MAQPSNVASLEVYILAASEPNKPRNFLWSADVNINASLHLVILFKSMYKVVHLLVCKQSKRLWEPQTSKNIDCLRAPCLLHQYCQWLQQQKKKRKEEAYPWKAGAGSGHITNLKQSILETFDIYGMSQQFCEITSSPKII